MLHNALIGFALYLGYFVAAGLPAILLKLTGKLPREVSRKMYHFVITLSIFPLLHVFDTWYAAVIAAVLFALLVYPILMLVEKSSLYKQIAVERDGGEFKTSLLIVQISLAVLIFIFWGLLGITWQYIAVVAVMAWGFGDAAAALVGKKFGRRKIQHRRIAGTKTVEGSLAMYAVAGLSIFLSLLLYAGQPWQVSAIVALLVAPVCSVVELFSPHGMDTITVPISAAFVILPLMYLLSNLGVWL